jgi:hypothetical protein
MQDVSELILERDAPERPLDVAAKRALIESELRKDAGRSDREIARVVGCDHKTVGTARERLGLAVPLGNSPPTPTEQRQMLIEGCKDFDKKYPPGPSEVGSAAAAVDNAIAKGVVKLAPEDDPDMISYWPIPRQAAIECRTVVNGDVEVWQEGEHGLHGAADAVTVHVAAGNVVRLARSILYAAGFRTVSIYTHEKGGNVDIEDGQLAKNFYEDDDKPGYGPVR